MEGLPGLLRNVLGQLVAFLRVELHPLEIAHDDTDRRLLGDTLVDGIPDILRNADLGRGDGKIRLRPIHAHGSGNTPLHEGLVNTQQPAAGHPLRFQQGTGEEDVVPGVGGAILDEDILPGHTALHCHPGKTVGFRLRQHTLSIAAQAAGEQHLGGISVPVKLGCPPGDIHIEITETHNAIRFSRRNSQPQIIPQDLQRLQVFHQQYLATAASIIATQAITFGRSLSTSSARGARTLPMSGPPVRRRISLMTAYMLPWQEHIL